MCALWWVASFIPLPLEGVTLQEASFEVLIISIFQVVGSELH